ncbi:MAG: LLM class F420-dependent oxidoreductase, partial [Gammaproteobacteria bacterium]|nr:LLM class F420-dependent oxidoreductase [Gammaproteobacteria bacterium]
AVHAETVGFESVWVSEHLFHSTYVAKRLGSRPYHDPLTVLTAIACATSRVRLGTSVLVLPWHHPARLAKTIASLDDLSQGRVDLGIGVAVTEDEFANLGVPFNTRGRQTDDALEAMLALWTQDIPEHSGEFYRFSGLRAEPKPVQLPLPIHVGGNTLAALKRVVRFGQGWHGLSQSPRSVEQRLAEIHDLCAAEGRNPEELFISVRTSVQIMTTPWDRPVRERNNMKGTEAELLNMVREFEDVGVHKLVIDPATADLKQYHQSLDILARMFLN